MEKDGVDPTKIEYKNNLKIIIKDPEAGPEASTKAGPKADHKARPKAREPSKN